MKIEFCFIPIYEFNISMDGIDQVPNLTSMWHSKCFERFYQSLNH